MTALAYATTAISILAMAASLWLGGYVVTRSPRSRLAWQAAFTLWSLAGIFFDAVATINPSRFTDHWPGWPVNLPFAVWCHLSAATLPPERARRQRPYIIAVYIIALAADVLVGLTPWVVADARHGYGVALKLFTPGPLFPVLPIGIIGLSLLPLYNFRAARQAAPTPAHRKQLDVLIGGTALGILGVSYAMVVNLLHVAAPSLPLLLALGCAVGLLGYGTARYSALTEGRVIRYDFAFSGLLVVTVALLYAAVMRFSPMPLAVQVLVLALVIITHTVYDSARRLLDWLALERPERALRAALHATATEVGEGETVQGGLQGALTALVTAVDARWGLIATRENDAFVAQATHAAGRVGERLPLDGLEVDELTVIPSNAPSRPIEDLTVIVPLAFEDDSLGVMLLGSPRGGLNYTPHDLDLIAEAADRLAELMHNVRRQETQAHFIGQILESFKVRERELQAIIEAFRRPAQSQPVTAGQIAEVEEALRQLHDYSYLGALPLAASVLARFPQPPPFGHLDRGKALHAALLAAIEKLRPAGAEPRELPPRDWHLYLVLRNAYVNGDANRDITSRLYISEATFHRTRRRALQAVAQALFEMDLPASIGKLIESAPGAAPVTR
jgi:hypothetical protein